MSNNPFVNPPKPSDLPPSYEDATAAGGPPGYNAKARQRQQGPHPPPLLQTSSQLGGPSGPAWASASRPSPSSAVARQFPPVFNLYSDGWSREMVLGEHQAAPLYAVRLHTGWSGEPPVVLHNGPSEASPPLAAVDFASWGSEMIVTLPPLRPGATTGEELRVDADYGGWRRLFRFAVEVGDLSPSSPSPPARELFEWRHSYGDAIAMLGGASDGWKLVRLATSPPPGLPPGSTFVPGGMTSDGREVVAAWTDATMSMTKRAKFAFLGTGQSGLLGERWAVMAVVTALGIYEKERRSRNRRHH